MIDIEYKKLVGRRFNKKYILKSDRVSDEKLRVYQNNIESSKNEELPFMKNLKILSSKQESLPVTNCPLSSKQKTTQTGEQDG